MMAAKDFIVAIELGSSKMTGIAGKKELDGNIKVLAIVKEDSSSFIKKGTVYNIEKTSLCIKSIIEKLQIKLKAKISKVYIGIGGQSVRGILNTITKDLPTDMQITQQMIDELTDTNYNMKYADQEVLDVAAQEYLVDNQLQTNPVGVQCSDLKGNYLTILQRKTFYDRLNSCIKFAKIQVIEIFLAPMALAESVLTETERRSGCALIDIGADTTTVSVFSKNILRHLAVIPLGSNNITKDIAYALKIEESDAEQLKIKYASAFTESKDIDESQMLPIDNERSIEAKRLIDIVEGRIQEIVENVIYQIPQRYTDNLLGGIILTGGGSNMKNIDKAFIINRPHIEKIRIAKNITNTVISSLNELKQSDGTLCTILGLLAKGDRNCAGGEITQDPGLFPETPIGPDNNIELSPNNPKRNPGTVMTPEDKKRAEEEAAKRKKEEEERKQEEEARLKKEEEERKKEEQRRKRENSVLRKGLRSMWIFGKKMIEPDEE